MTHRTCSHTAGAFTLIDTVLTVAIIALLVSIAIPTLSGVQDASLDTVSLSNLRTHAQMISIYADDHDGYYPYLTDPDAESTEISGAGKTVDEGFFWLSDFWYLGLTDAYYGSSLDRSLFGYPGPEGGIVYLYSPTLFSRPRYWNPATRLGPSQWRPVRQAEAAYPSLKVGFTEFRPIPEAIPFWTQSGPSVHGARHGYGFLDGSARRPPVGSIAPQMLRGDNAPRPHLRFGAGVVGQHTIDGINGRDFQ